MKYDFNYFGFLVRLVFSVKLTKRPHLGYFFI